MRKAHPGNLIKSAFSLTFALGLAASAHAQTVLIQDGFGGGGGLGGSAPDTVNTPGSTWNATGNTSRGIGVSYTDSPVFASYTAGDPDVGGFLAFTPTTGSAVTVSSDIYLRSGQNPVYLGFNNNNQNGSFNLDVRINSDGSGTLQSGSVSTDFSAAANYTPSTGPGSTVGLNNYSVTYDPNTALASVTEDGNVVASANVGNLTVGYAGFQIYYGVGFQNGTSDPTGFDNFTISEMSSVPEPATYIAGFLCLGVLVVRWKRNVSAAA